MLYKVVNPQILLIIVVLAFCQKSRVSLAVSHLFLIFLIFEFSHMLLKEFELLN
jgi:hypothetical protein